MNNITVILQNRKPRRWMRYERAALVGRERALEPDSRSVGLHPGDLWRRRRAGSGGGGTAQRFEWQVVGYMPPLRVCRLVLEAFGTAFYLGEFTRTAHMLNYVRSRACRFRRFCRHRRRADGYLYPLSTPRAAGS